jgi:hypothetical protein
MNLSIASSMVGISAGGCHPAVDVVTPTLDAGALTGGR